MRTLFISLLLAPLCGCAGVHGRKTGMENPAIPSRTIEIELLALDLDTCGRCTRTDRNLDAALDAVSRVFREAGAEVRVSKHVIRSAEEAVRHRFVSSPTIRLDGRDIALELRESDCADCGELCGCASPSEGAVGVDCRVWVWQGREFLEAPKAMIVDALLSAYGAPTVAPVTPDGYRLPENLRAFFEARRAQPGEARKSCSGGDPGCCEPAAGAAAGCCDGDPACCEGAEAAGRRVRCAAAECC